MIKNLICETLRCELKSANHFIASHDGAFPEHMHDFYEICIVLNDKADFITEKNIYNVPQNNLILIPPYIFHHAVINKVNNYKRLIIWFRINMDNNHSIFKEIFNKINTYDFSMNENICNSISMFIALMTKIERNLILEIAESFLTNLIYQLYFFLQSKPETKMMDIFVKSVLDYINENIDKKMTLSSISEHFHISGSNLEKIFRDNMQFPIMAYIRKKRLMKAKLFIQNGEKPTQVYYKCGFYDYTTFYKSFIKEFGVSPKTLIKP